MSLSRHLSTTKNFKGKTNFFPNGNAPIFTMFFFFRLQMISTCVLDLAPQATLEPAHGPRQLLQLDNHSLPAAVSFLSCHELARGSLATRLAMQLWQHPPPRQQDARDPRLAKQTDQRKVEEANTGWNYIFQATSLPHRFLHQFLQQNINVFRFFSYLLFSNSTLFDPKIFSDWLNLRWD